MKRTRLSMKLLRRYFIEYGKEMASKKRPLNNDDWSVYDFLDFVESQMKPVSERHETPTTTKRKSLTK